MSRQRSDLDDGLSSTGKPIPLWVARETPELAAGTMRRGLFDIGSFTSTVESLLEHDLYERLSFSPQVTRQNPSLNGEQIARLDDDGLICVGSTVSEGDVLASIVQAIGPGEGDQFQTGDGSWYVPQGWNDSRVVAITRELTAGHRHDYPKGVIERLIVRLRREIPFSLSDLLQVGDAVIRAAAIADDVQMPRTAAGEPADLIVSENVARSLGLSEFEMRQYDVVRVGVPAIDVVKARSVGAYSLISGVPLGGRLTRKSGILIRDNQLQWLIDRGLFGLVQEFVSLKHNDLRNRDHLRKFATQGDLGQISPAAPETLIEFMEYVWGLGLVPDVKSGDRCVALALRPASNTEIAARSCGEIRKTETLNYRTYRPEPGGLFCESIFGAETSPVRRRRAGHIELEEPIIPIIWRLGTEPILARILKIPHKRIEAIILRRKDVFVRSGTHQFVDHQEHPNEELLADGWEFFGTGVLAIRNLLQSVPKESLSPTFQAGGFDFSLQMLPVIPPDFRPLVLLDSGNFATADVNDLYRRVINRNNRLRKLKELKAPEVILNNEISQLQTVIDTLQANLCCSRSRQAMGNERRPLVCLLTLICRKITDPHPRRVEWAGQARSISSPHLPRNTVGLPSVIYDELRLAQVAGTSSHRPGAESSSKTSNEKGNLVLLTSAGGRFQSRLAVRIGGPVIHLNPDDAASLQSDNDAIVEVHRPLTDAARSEAMRLMDYQDEPDPIGSEADPDDWFQHSQDTAVIDGLIRAAQSGRPISMNSFRGIAVLGTGATESILVDSSKAPKKHFQPARPTPTT